MEPTAVPTPEQLRGLAHPVRLKMLGILRTDGPQTSTTLAARLGLNTGAASYHLRNLASHGFVVEAPDLGTGRERWWQAAHRFTRLPDIAAPDAEAYLQTVISRHAQLLQEGAEEFSELPPEWKQASDHSDWVVRMSPARARALTAQVHEILEAARAEAEAAPADDDAEQVAFQLHAFPLPGRLPHREP